MRFKFVALFTVSALVAPALTVTAQEGPSQRSPRERPQFERRERTTRPERTPVQRRPVDRDEMLNRMRQRQAEAVESGDTERADAIAARIRMMEERAAQRPQADDVRERRVRPEGERTQRPGEGSLLERMQARHDQAVQDGDEERAAAIKARMERVREREAARAEDDRETEPPRRRRAPERSERPERPERPARPERGVGRPDR